MSTLSDSDNSTFETAKEISSSQTSLLLARNGVLRFLGPPSHGELDIPKSCPAARHCLLDKWSKNWPIIIRVSLRK